MKHPDMERREFLKKAGLSATALAASLGLSSSLPAPVLADERGRIGFILVAISTVATDETHGFAMTGNGTFGKHGILGGGTYVHFDRASGPPPLTLLEHGTWRAKRLMGWRKAEGQPNPFGPFLSGILDLTVRLFPEGGPRRGVPARMAVI
jgi:hypothetical protein